MARLVVKCKYLKGGGKKRGGYVKYIATREGVAKIDKSQRSRPVTKNQEELIKNLLNDFPDTKEMLEYEDYIKYKTVGTASDFISRAIEENINKIDEETTTYADYIATRPGAEYISGTHGLFTNAGVPINLEDVSDELNKFQGNVWTIICSLRREDAKTLGFESGERWRDMLRSQAISLANNLKIPIENFKWYAAFHNESYHPHIHLIAYSTEPKEGFLTKKGIENIKSAFANDIFAEEMTGYYQKQTEIRNELRFESSNQISQIINEINADNYNNPKIRAMLIELADKLSRTNGKKVYGYLKPELKAIVNSVVDEMAADTKIKQLYNLWYEQRENIIRIYNQKVPKRLPLSEITEFKPIKNAVIREAMNIQLQAIEETPIPNIPIFNVDSDLPPEPTEFDIPDEDYISENRIEVSEAELYGYKGRKENNWWNDTYKQARKYLYGSKNMSPDFQKAFYLLEGEADRGNGFAMYDVGRMYMSGLGCEKSENTAQEWFAKAYHAFIGKIPEEKDPSYLQYRIGKLYAFGYGVEQDFLKTAEWYESAVAKGNPFAAYSLGCLYRKGQGVEQNDITAFQLFTMAATHEIKPNAYAQYELGTMCRDGTGTDIDLNVSEEWYKKSYNGFLKILGDMPDDNLYYRVGKMNLTGMGTTVDLIEAKNFFEKSAELDNVNALYGLGKLYLNENFEEYNVHKAIEYLTNASAEGHDCAQYMLGKLYLEGKETEKNTNLALHWLEKSVEQENPYAQYLLGKTLLYGKHDVSQNIDQGVELLEKSLMQGNIYAAYTLGKLKLQGTLVTQDIPEAVNLLTFAADKGSFPAQYQLGRLYSNGKYIEKNIPKALNYLLQAAEQGDTYSMFQLGIIYLHDKELQDTETGLQYLQSAAENGNPYAAEYMQQYQENKACFAVQGAIGLFHHLAMMFRDYQQKNKHTIPDERKIRIKIAEKKQAQGQKQD